MKDTLSHLYDLLGRAVLLAIPPGKKRPTQPGWQKITFTDTQAPAYQAELLERIRRGGNIGVLLGQISAGIVTIDLDQDDAPAAFLKLNPLLADTLRSRGARGCQIWIRNAPKAWYPNTQAYYPLKTTSGDEYGEWRCGGAGGAQTVIWGTHPTPGVTYQILVDKPPLEVEFNKIVWPADVVLPWLQQKGASLDKRITAYVAAMDPAIQDHAVSPYLSARYRRPEFGRKNGTPTKTEFGH